MRVVLAVLLAATVTACMVTDEGALGRFELEASRTESCGDSGLLASTATLKQVVYLRQADSRSLQWDDGTNLLIFDVDPDGVSFHHTRGLVVDMRVGDEEGESKPACLVARADVIDGVLEEGTARGEYSGFDVTMTYEFTATEGSSCDDLVGGPDGMVEVLPCRIGYEGHADRVE